MPGPLRSTLDTGEVDRPGGASAIDETLERARGDGDASGSGSADDSSRIGHRMGRFRLLRLLGQGGMGVVHTAYDQILDRVVALKTLRADRGSSGVVGRFIREAKALARLSHPNIVQIYDVSASDGQVFLAMEYIQGQTLGQQLEQRGADAPHEPVLELFIQAGRGLEAAHRAGLVHRDFKPDNVMVGVDGRVRVMDFGLVRVAAETHERHDDGPADVAVEGVSTDLTVTGSVLGTPAYMAPEQHRGAETDLRADVYSFCASLYEALYRQRPFVGDSYERLRAASLAGVVRPPTQARVPAWLRAVVLRGLQVDPADRWPDMQPLLAALAADPAVRRRRLLRRLGLATLIAVLAVAGTALTLYLRREWLQARVEALAAERLVSVEAEPRADRAEAVFHAFVTDPAHQGTQALVRAWQQRGDRRRTAGDKEGALADFARAYADARAPGEAQAAMRRIAGVYFDDWDTIALARAVRALPVSPDDREGRDFLIAAALRRRDLVAADALLADAPQAALADARPLLQALMHARRIDFKGVEAVALASGGPHVAALVDESRHELVLLDHALQPARRWHAEQILWLTGGAPWGLMRDGEQGVLFDVSAPEVALARFAAPLAMMPRGVLDANGDGQPELYFGFAAPLRGFKVLDPARDPRVRSAHAGSERTDSYLVRVVAADLDADGTQEIVAAIGPHRAYDLRVFHVDAGGELELVGRNAFGRVEAIGVLRRPGGEQVLVATHDTQGINADVFPEPPHIGPTPGVYLLGWTGSQLVERAYLPAEPGKPLVLGSNPLYAGDLDGDGVEELALAQNVDGKVHTLLVRQDPGGGLHSLVLGHSYPLAALQLDDDAALELLITDRDTHELWALGVGATPLPPVAIPVPAAAAPPEGLRDELLLERWTRAHELAALGLSATAAEVLRDAAAFVAEAPLRLRLRDRAAVLFADAGQAEAALELGAEALVDPELAPGALLRSIELLTGLGRYPEAVAAAEQLRGHAGSSAEQAAIAETALARLMPLLAGDAVELRFDGPLSPAWRLDRPSALHLDAAGRALRVEAIGTQSRLASLPLQWDGGPLQIEVELDILHAEYHTRLSFILLDGAGKPVLGVGFGGGGDRSYRHHSSHCQPVGHEGTNIDAHTVTTAATRHHLLARAAYFPDRGVTECEVDDEGRRQRVEFIAASSPTPGRYTLVLGNRPGEFAPHLIAADVRRISIRGARIEETGAPLTLEERAGRAVVAGEPLAALAMLAGAPNPALELLAYDQLHDAHGVARTIDAAVASLGDFDLLQLLRTRPGLEPALRAAAGPRLLPLLAEGWRHLARHHFDDPELQRRLLAALRGIETSEALDDGRRQALCALLHARALIHRQLGDVDAARRDHEAALVALGAAPDDPELPLRAANHLALALLLADRDPVLAHRHAAQALACAAAPELVQDRLRREPALADRLADDPAWRSLLALDVALRPLCGG